MLSCEQLSLFFLLVLIQNNSCQKSPTS
jgi:hypothetical protein